MSIWRTIGLLVCWVVAGAISVRTPARISVYVPEFVRWYPVPPPGCLEGLTVFLFLGICGIGPYLVSEYEKCKSEGCPMWGGVFRRFAAIVWTWFLWIAIVKNGLLLLDAHLAKQPLDVALALKRVLVTAGGLSWWGLKLVSVTIEPFRLFPFIGGVTMAYAGLAPFVATREWKDAVMLGNGGVRRKAVAVAGQPQVRPQPGPPVAQPPRPAAQPKPQPSGQAAQPKPQPRPRDLKAFDRLVGLEEPIAVLREALEIPILRPELVKTYRLEVPRGLLLEGPPGTGKTSLARAAANYFGCAFGAVSLARTLGSLVGQSERNLHSYFAWAKQNAPAILFFDELDSIARVRDSHSLNRPQDVLLNVLLTELDGFHSRHGVFVMAATNRVDVLDPAILRPGRFDRVVHIGLPGKEARRKLFALYLQGRPVDPKVDLDFLAERTEGKSPADIEAICNQAAWRAAYNVIHTPGAPGAPQEVPAIVRPLLPEDFPV